MARVWSEEGKLARWLDVELAALDALGRARAPSRRGRRGDPRAAPSPPTPERVREIEERDAATTSPPSSTPSPKSSATKGRWLHYGLTSSDVLDTALALQVREAGALLLGRHRPRASPRSSPGPRSTAQTAVHRPHARHPRRADDVRAEARRLGVRARHASACGSSARWKGCASASSRARSARTPAADPELERLACERLGLEPAPRLDADHPARPACGAALPRSRVIASSLERFALEIRHLARTEVREVEEPFGSGQKGSSAMPHKRNPIIAERICGLARVVRAAALVGLENVAALARAGHLALLAPSASSSPTRSSPLDYMLDRFAWLVEGLVVHAERMRREPRREPRPRLQPARCCSRSSSRAWPATTPTGSSSATRCRPGTRSRDFRELVAADPEIAGLGVDLDSGLRPRRRTRATSTSCSTACAALDERRTIRCLRLPSIVASGKVREIYALDDERLLLVASDRISTFDVVLPTEIPDKGRVLTGPLGVLVRAHARDRPEPPARAARRRPLDRVPAAGDAADRVRRARLPRRLGLEGLPARPARSAGTRCPRGCASRTGCRSRSSRPRRRRTEGHDENIDAATRRSELVGAERFAEVGARRARAVPLRLRARGASAGSSSPTRSSSSASTRTGGSCSATRRSRPTRRASGPPTSTRRAAPQPSFDKQFVRDYCETLGWDKTAPGPELPADVVAGTRARYVEAFERLTGLAFDDYLADPRRSLR